jgi:hypothetical protein
MKKEILIQVLIMKTSIIAETAKNDRVLTVIESHGPYYFDTIRNWDKEKNKLLEAMVIL